jgi:hypothetical protein
VFEKAWQNSLCELADAFDLKGVIGGCPGNDMVD